MKRIDFVKLLSFGTLAGIVPVSGCGTNVKKNKGPIIISTWDSGKEVNEAAWPKLSKGNIMDGIEAGGNFIEDSINCCVGLGGNPDREGIVTLDACVMDHKGGCGAVAALELIKHPISVARQVMTETPHVLIAGVGAQQFAIEMGHKLESSELSKSANKQYQEWLEKAKYQPVINIENQVPKKLSNGEYNHDTMAMIAKNRDSDLGGGVTTSGMGFKMRGRVGDSPIIGAGLYVDNEIGAATSSGVGEEVIRNVGSHLVVELMRQGRSPQEACKEAILRIINRKDDKAKDIQVGFIALAKDGSYGAFSIQPGFQYAVKTEEEHLLLDSSSYYN